MVWPPERAVKSRALRPLAANMEVRVARLENGEGIWVLAALWFAVLASLRPRGTAHEGPPSYKRIKIIESGRVNYRKKNYLRNIPSCTNFPS